MFENLTQKLSSAFAFVRGNAQLDEQNIEEGLRAVRAALLEADVHVQVAREFVDKVRERVLGEKVLAGVEASQQFVHACHQELVALLGAQEARLEFAKLPPTVILMAGLQGAGKTTTCAKLAKLLKTKHSKRPLLVAADVKRPAAVEQLRVLGQQIDVPVFHVEGLAAPEVCFRGVQHARISGADVVILDTAGRLHVDDALMNEVADVAKRTQPHDQILVVDSMTGQDAVRSAKAFHERLALTGVILTKLDGDARGGAALSIKSVVGRPILFVGVGEKIDDLESFVPDRVAGRILGLGDVVGLVETAQQNISEQEAQAAYEKMVLGDFTLEDMLQQLRMIQRLGPMKKVLGMLPGMSQLGDLDKLVDENRFKRMEALFTSMTPRERLQPDLIDMSRRRRIARGAGQDPNAVGDLLKAHRGMKQMMKEMNRLGLGAKMGMKQKKDALRSMSPTGELAANSGGGGLLGGLGGLGDLLGGGGGARGGGMLGGLGGMANPFARPNRPMGSSPTRQSGSKRKKDKNRKKNR